MRGVLGTILILLWGATSGWSGPLPPLPRAAGEEKAPPPPLQCLTRWYTGEARFIDGQWWLELPGGTRIPYDDGRKKTLEMMLEAPDVEDVFAMRYVPGPIRPVTTPDEDPGRVRLEPLFAATYGRTRAAVDVVPIPFLGQRLKVHRRAAPAFHRVASRLEGLLKTTPSLRPFLTGLGGTFEWRTIAGTTRQSAHSYGVSIDLNTGLSHYWRWQRPAAPIRWRNRIPQAIVDAFEAEGFIWGGRWYHYDTMHFEYRPELLEAGCYPGVAPVLSPPPRTGGSPPASR